jgi:microcystin-dependent protein
MKKIRILVILSVALLIFGGLVTQGILASGDQPQGKPLQALWDAVNDLDDRVTSEVSRLDLRIDNEGVPVGAIMMWSGTIAPDNWHICDGTSGTPDLQDRFIVGSGSSYAIGDTGGAAMVTLDISQMPSHRHHYSGTTSAAGAHTHEYYDIHLLYTPGGNLQHDGSDADVHWTTDSRTTSSAGAHSHTYSGYTDYQGENAPHENCPPYYALAYIMKVQ